MIKYLLSMDKVKTGMGGKGGKFQVNQVDRGRVSPRPERRACYNSWPSIGLGMWNKPAAVCLSEERPLELRPQ